MKKKSLIFTAAALGIALGARAGVTCYVVDPMSDHKYMPDAAPAGGMTGTPVRVTAALGEFELRVLPFELPPPGCVYDPDKNFRTTWCWSYDPMQMNGGDAALAKKLCV